MPYAAWAHAIVTADTLEGKLIPPWTGGQVPAGIPDQPGRPVELTMAPAGKKRRAGFPGEQRLHEPEARGQVLHFFANHELLALELMALALIRMPEAPSAFRRGLVGIIVDEQRHLREYMTRMAAVDIRFGDLPVNRYLWDTLQGCSPLELVAGLSLTFEQANLDYASHYAAAFRRVGDEETAATLDRVLADEVRHVAHGLRWFDRWRDPTQTRWESWTAALRPPLTPSRAKGSVFFRAPRLAAGLDAETIARTEVFGASVGRPPWVYSFDPEVEADVAGDPPSAVGQRVAGDLASLLVLLAARHDAVVVARAPTPAFLADFAAAGITLPEVVVGGPSAFAERKISGVRPWGGSPRMAVWAGVDPLMRWDPRWRALYEKSWSVARLAERPDLCDPAVIGVVCHTWDEVMAAANAASVVKAPLGTAGRAMLRWTAPTAAAWTQGVLKAQGAVVVEPWLERLLDLSLQFDVEADGSVVAGTWGRFLTDGRGHYQGAVLGHSLGDAPSDVRRCVAEGAPRLLAMAEHLGPAMAALGYTGPAGLDALVYRDGERMLLKPLVELNPRFTMGRVAKALDRRVHRGAVGLWLHVTLEQVKKLGWDGFVPWATDLRARASVVTVGTPPQVASGALFTTDPAVAERLVTVLVVAPTLAACRAVLAVGR